MFWDLVEADSIVLPTTTIVSPPSSTSATTASSSTATALWYIRIDGTILGIEDSLCFLRDP